MEMAKFGGPPIDLDRQLFFGVYRDIKWSHGEGISLLCLSSRSGQYTFGLAGSYMKVDRLP